MTLNSKNILITGGTGSFGSAFIKHLCKSYNFKKLIIFSRDELKQLNLKNDLKRDFPQKYEKLRFFIGDIRDKDRVEYAFNDVNIIIHAAALKQVDTIEYNPFEAIKTNIIGTQNLIDASLKNNVDKFIGLSTDKASSPINLYGATKLASDRLIIAANEFRGSKKTRFSCVRYGNVWGSRGSVLHLFKDQLKRDGFLKITDKKMTRFSITLSESVNFVLMSLKNMQGGEIFIPKIPSYNVIDLANAFTNSKKKEIGIRPGEKINEELFSKEESRNVIEFKDYFKLVFKKNKKNKNLFIKKPFAYTSDINKYFLNTNTLKKMISDNLF